MQHAPERKLEPDICTYMVLRNLELLAINTTLSVSTARHLYNSGFQCQESVKLHILLACLIRRCHLAAR